MVALEPDSTFTQSHRTMFNHSAPARVIRMFTFLLALAVLLLPATDSALAQDAVNKIEVKDGKVYVNGEMVKELEDADLPLHFNGDRSSSSGNIMFFSDDNDKKNVYTLKGNNANVGSFVFDMDNNAEMEILAERHLGMAQNMLASGDFYRKGLAQWKSAPFGAYGIGGATDEIRELERKSLEIARSYRDASADEQIDLGETLKQILEQIFDLKEENTTERLTRMNDELNKLRERVAERSASREDIIQRRYNELVGAQDALAW